MRPTAIEIAAWRILLFTSLDYLPFLIAPYQLLSRLVPRFARIFFLGIAKAFWNHRHCRWFSLYKKIAPSPKTQGEEILRGTTCIPGRPGAQGSVTGGPGRAYCVQPDSSEATKIRTRKGLHRPPSLWGCVFGSYSSSQLVTIWGSDAYTSSMMGEGFACCGLTSARNLLRDSRTSLSA